MFLLELSQSVLISLNIVMGWQKPLITFERSQTESQSILNTIWQQDLLITTDNTNNEASPVYLQLSRKYTTRAFRKSLISSKYTGWINSLTMRKKIWIEFQTWTIFVVMAVSNTTPS